MSQIREKIVHFGSRRSALVRSRSTYVAVWLAWIGLGGLWAPFWVAAVSFGEISVYVCGGLAGLDRFGGLWAPFWVAAVKKAESPLNPSPEINVDVIFIVYQRLDDENGHFITCSA